MTKNDQQILVEPGENHVSVHCVGAVTIAAGAEQVGRHCPRRPGIRLRGLVAEALPARPLFLAAITNAAKPWGFLVSSHPPQPVIRSLRARRGNRWGHREPLRHGLPGTAGWRDDGVWSLRRDGWVLIRIPSPAGARAGGCGETVFDAKPGMPWMALFANGGSFGTGIVCFSRATVIKPTSRRAKRRADP